MTFVLDASAIICWLGAEPGSTRMEELLLSDQVFVVHGFNWLEVRYYLLRHGDEPLARGSARALAAGIRVEMALTDSMIGLATELKAHRTPISLADALAVAFAVDQSATLLTTDRSEMEKLTDICSIEFLR